MEKHRRTARRGSPPFVCLQISPCHALRICLNFLRRPGRHDASAALPAAGAHVDDVVCATDHVQVVLDDDDSGSLTDEGLEDEKEGLHVQRVEADGGLVKDKDRVPLGAAISLASFSRWASPPESPGVSSPRVR